MGQDRRIFVPGSGGQRVVVPGATGANAPPEPDPRSSWSALMDASRRATGATPPAPDPDPPLMLAGMPSPAGDDPALIANLTQQGIQNPAIRPSLDALRAILRAK